MMSSHAVEWMLLDHAAREPVQIGDLVSVDAGGMPIFRVLALAGGRAWLRGERSAAAYEAALDRFRWKARAAA